MAITTTNGKLAVMEMETIWEPGLPMSPGSIGQDDKQQLLWGFPEVLWDAIGGVMIGVYNDMNTRLLVYLQAYYSTSQHDLTTLADRHLNEQTSGDRTQKVKQLIQDATDAMTP
jgi:hypothetical protein